MIAVDCLDKKTLQDLLDGRLPSVRFEAALRHVDGCQQCATLAAELSASGQEDRLVGILAASDSSQDKLPPISDFDDESQCHIAIGNLLIQTPASSSSVQANVPQENLGPYRLLRSLGIGGMGAVYLAEHQKLKRLVAIKLLPRDKLTRAGWLERFEREMTAVAALEHPHVVRAIDAGESEGWHYLVMEHLDGLDLSRVGRRIPEISVGAACEVMRQAALGLSAVHEQGLVHRDVKPSNIFLASSGVAKLLDLGLVLDGESPLATDERLTTVGHLMGTLPYMAREQLLDPRSVDARTDIYALGATLTKLLTGTPPFGATTHLPTLIQAINTQSCPPLSSRRADVDFELAKIVDGMLDHDPSRRPQSAAEVAEQLAPYCDGRAASALIKAALQCDPVADELSSAQPKVQLGSGNESAEGNHAGRWKWLAWAMVPLAFAAGILLTVVTDNGTLTIKTDEDNVAVRILQGQEEVRSFVVERDTPQKLTLRSGTYAVELTGLEAQELTLSDDRLAITRGSEELLTVTRQPESNEPAKQQVVIANESVYQGQTFEQWLEVLAHDRDIESLDKAMEGLVLLADTNEEKLVVAKAMLKAARTYGGIELAGRISQQLAQPSGFGVQRDFNSLSGYFMSAFCDCFPRLLPEPGLQAITAELEEGNSRSWQACAMAFHSSGGVGQTLARSVNPSNPKQRMQLRALLRALGPCIDHFNLDRQQPNQQKSALATTYRLLMGFKLSVAENLDQDLSGESQFADWAEFQLDAARTFLARQVVSSNYEGRGMGGMAVGVSVEPTDFSNDEYGGLASQFPFTASDAVRYFEVLKHRDIDLSPLAVGIARGDARDIESGLAEQRNDAQLLAAFREICQRDYPMAAQVLEQFVAACVTIPVVDGGFGYSANYIRAYAIEPELAREIASVLIEHHPSPFKVPRQIVAWSEKCKLFDESEPIDWNPFVEQALQRAVLQPSSADADEQSRIVTLSAYRIATLQLHGGLFEKGIDPKVLDVLEERMKNIVEPVEGGAEPFQDMHMRDLMNWHDLSSIRFPDATLKASVESIREHQPLE